MKTIIELISNEVMTAFKEAGYDENMGKVTLSNRPDLCEYQCNGAMAGAKVYHCLLYTSPSPRDGATSRMPSSA